jgi:hypothetical protein
MYEKNKFLISITDEILYKKGSIGFLKQSMLKESQGIFHKGKLMNIEKILVVNKYSTGIFEIVQHASQSKQRWRNAKICEIYKFMLIYKNYGFSSVSST